MSAASDPFAELRTLLEAVCEERLSESQAEQLEQLVLRDPEACRFYLEYIELHGNLHWDAAQSQPPSRPHEPAAGAGKKSRRSAAKPVSSPRAFSRTVRRRVLLAAAAATGCLATLLVVLALWQNRADRELPQKAPSVAINPATSPPRDQAAERRRESLDKLPVQEVQAAMVKSRPRRAVQDSAHAQAAASLAPVGSVMPLPGIATGANLSRPPKPPRNDARRDRGRATRSPLTDSALLEDESADFEPVGIVEFVDARIGKGWRNAGIKPSPKAGDGEWLRRVYLDLVGYIPPERVVDEFLDDRGEKKRTAVVERLLKDSSYARNWGTLWANLLVGRHPRARGVSHQALEKFLRDSFASNTPWNDVVYELVAAEGTTRQSPATNFLLAHLNNDALPATALTARLFLGIQVQCTQCHDHPFHNDKQNHFWELNSFFQQTEMVKHPAAAGSMPGRADSDSPLELLNRKVGGAMFYETRRGEMRAVFPVYVGHKIDPSPTVNRRKELARLIAKGDDPQLALAMVNRMWQHFLGYGFTRPVDDMGSHNPPSHPEVLSRLSKEFIASGYDLKQLIRWIVASEAYQRTSAFGPGNGTDDPALGGAPLFSRVYLKPMTVEQLYDSLLVATRAKSSARTDWNDVGRRREDWVRQFVRDYGTDENDEAALPAGSVSQALSMMNDRIVDAALALEPGTLLGDVADDATEDAAKIRRLCRCALSRNPTPAEQHAAAEHLRLRAEDSHDRRAAEKAGGEALQDIFWAFLNSNEFALVH